MKRQISATWLMLLTLASLALISWIVLLYILTPVFLYDGNIDVSKTMTDAQLHHMMGGARALVRFTVIPSLILTCLWVMAFVSERKELNNLRKKFSQN